jgi:hypothetical protein
VAIAVLKDILGHCFDAQRDSVGYTEFGRCASGQSGILPGFDAIASWVSDEGRLVSYLRAQLVLCWDKGWYHLGAHLSLWLFV